uniref:Uncharacterized protein n=1 Tax=mine drainage metagenome TaxID=410659 RepID=E6QTU7_9ZZZZ
MLKFRPGAPHPIPSPKEKRGTIIIFATLGEITLNLFTAPLAKRWVGNNNHFAALGEITLNPLHIPSPQKVGGK